MRFFIFFFKERVQSSGACAVIGSVCSEVKLWLRECAVRRRVCSEVLCVQGARRVCSEVFKLVGECAVRFGR